jgi:hypothetical protein
VRTGHGVGSLARLTVNSLYVRLNSHACGTPSRCTGTAHGGDTRCRVRACRNESQPRPTRVAHLCFAPILSERDRYQKRKAPRDERPAEFQYCLRAWLSREPRRMGASSERLQGGEHRVWGILPSGQRVIIGFCLIRQSSVSPIVSVHQSNQLSGPHSIGIPRRFMVVPWANERRVGSSRRSSFRVT